MAIKHNDVFASGSDYARGQGQGMIDISQAGTKQFAPDLSNIAGNSPYVRRNLIPFLVEAPPFFQYLDDPQKAVASLKAIIETHTRTIDGLTQTLSPEYAQVPYGGSGESISAATNVTRAPSNPSHGMFELQGRSITKFIEFWIRWGIADENTKVPLIVSNGNVGAANYDATFAGCTILYVEPDPTMTEVVDSYLCTNMQPSDAIPHESSKDASQIGQNLDLSITFTATTDVGIGQKLFAREMLQRLNRGGMNPNDTKAWLDRIDASVSDSGNGLANQLEQGARDRISY